MNDDYASAPHVVHASTTPPAPPRRSGFRRGCLFTILLFFGLQVLGVVLLLVGRVALMDRLRDAHGKPDTMSGVDEVPYFREVWSTGRGAVKVVRIPIVGMILFEDRGWRSAVSGSAGIALDSIRRATMDPDVEGIILEIDSGGGGITASDVLYESLREFKRAGSGRVIVTMMGDVAASGAYYVAAASDHIIAHPTTLTGSIGVMMQTLNISELASRIGVRDVTIKSGENKDLLNPLSDMTEAQREMLQRVVDAMHARFVSVVSESRGLTFEETGRLADGRVFLAEEARDLGLIDAIGYSGDAQTAAAELLGEDDVRVYRYEVERSFFDLFRHSLLFGSGLDEWLFKGGETRLMYRWAL